VKTATRWALWPTLQDYEEFPEAVHLGVEGDDRCEGEDRSELKIAHDIQMGILPNHFPPSDRTEFDILAKIEPAREVEEISTTSSSWMTITSVSLSGRVRQGRSRFALYGRNQDDGQGQGHQRALPEKVLTK